MSIENFMRFRDHLEGIDHIEIIKESPTWGDHWDTGLHVQLDNGFIISIQYGPGTYSSHHGWLLQNYIDDPSWKLHIAWEDALDFSSSKTAEVAVWDGHFNYDIHGLLISGMDPSGYQTPQQVIDIITYLTSIQPPANTRSTAHHPQQPGDNS